MNLENISIGVDIEEIGRFRAKPQLFYKKIFTPDEQSYCEKKSQPEQHYAVRFCAKEAFIKALSGFGYDAAHIALNEIEVYHDERGYPMIRYEKDNKITSKISLSHNQTSAMACVIVSKN